MKRSKVFLSLTTCILALVALAAAKRSVNHSVCYTTFSGGVHHRHIVQAACTVTQLPGHNQCTVNGRPAFTTVAWQKKMYSGS